MNRFLSMHCRCGALRGRIRGTAGRPGFRVVCYCDDCQRFADFLSTNTGILDEHGGTDILQLSPARLAITRGTEHLACVRLTSRGPLRWYAGCCRTPIGNTPAKPQLPFLGLIHSCLDTEDRSLDTLLGPVRRRVMSRYARGDLSGLDASRGFTPAVLLGAIAKVVVWRMRGDHLRSPFFDPVTGTPVSAPRELGFPES